MQKQSKGRRKETESQNKLPKRTEDIQQGTEKGRRREKKMKELEKVKQLGFNFPPLFMEMTARNKTGRMSVLYNKFCRILKQQFNTGGRTMQLRAHTNRIITHVTVAIMWISQTFPIKFYKTRELIPSNLRYRAVTVTTVKHPPTIQLLDW